MPPQSDPNAETQVGKFPSSSDQQNTTSRTSLIGKTLGGRYLIERELGRGGMGVVYLARDKPELHSRPVVVKVLLEEALKNEVVVSKFYQEIESLTRLDDPGVIGIFDAGRLEDGAPYLVMQHVEGTTLRVAIRREGMDLQQAAAIIRQIGRSVGAAHDAGILHRDLKPENIMLRTTASGEQLVKIIDFGIAKVKKSMSGPSPLTGLTVGTIGYMSPEQLSAKPLTPASDIFSLGVIAYEMLTGRNPFNPDSVFQLVEMQREGVRVKPSDLRPSLPEAAQQILLKALAFDSKDRFQSAQEFGDRLAGALVSEYDLGERTTQQLAARMSAGAGNDLSQTVAAETLQGVATERSKPTLETAHVLFMDIVSYSRLLIDEQSDRLQELKDIVRATQEFQKAQLAGQLLRLPTGDGMALSFFGDPEAPVRCAAEVSRALREHPDIKLRMGVNSGLVYRIADINENLNISGGGINVAQRVMDCGDAGHILLSKRVADDLRQLSRWARDLHDLGEAVVKHDERVHIYNLYNDEIGNAEVPAKLRRPEPIPEPEPKSIKRWLVAAAAVIVVGSGLFLSRSLWKTGQPGTQTPVIVADTAPERVFRYFLTPFVKGNAEEERFAGNEQFHNGSTFKFVLIPEQSGALYLVNKGSGANGSTAWSVLFPTPKNNNGSSLVAASQRIEASIYFDRHTGDENLSIIWTAHPVPELETICKDAARTDFEIKNPAQIETITAFLNKHQSPVTKADVDADKKQTSVNGRGEILISTRVLKHREF
jgi:serine/threonine protein kinase